MEGLIKEFGASVGILVAAFGLMMWLVRMVMASNAKMVEGLVLAADKRILAETEERQNMRIAYVQTINNHLSAHNVSIEKLTSTIDQLRIEIGKMNGKKI